MYPNDPVTIQTPEQITMELAPAGIGSRFLALALDTVIQGVLYFALFLLAAFLLPAVAKSAGGAEVSGAWTGAIIILFIFCIYWGYFAAFEILWHGQTPGKRAAGIRVVKDTGRPITAIEGIGRNLMRAIDGLFFYLVGIISVVLSKQNKRLGDYVAGTIVIHDKKTSEVKPDWSFAAPAPDVFQPELSRLSEQDLVAIETFLHRRFDLEGMVRVNTAIQLSDRVQQKMGLAKPANQSDEEFLEATARQMRNQARLRT
ncbi:MAG TPA: RDD family protein [Candidatus Binatia bacterium]|nr:RDD family protein [Candidatus Binatia bacterium]